MIIFTTNFSIGLYADEFLQFVFSLKDKQQSYRFPFKNKGSENMILNFSSLSFYAVFEIPYLQGPVFCPTSA